MTDETKSTEDQTDELSEDQMDDVAGGFSLGRKTEGLVAPSDIKEGVIAPADIKSAIGPSDIKGAVGPLDIKGVGG